MSSISINGTKYSSNSVTVINGRIIIDGKEVQANDKVINIQIDGDVDNLNVDACERVTVHGRVTKLSTMSGDVRTR